jgi:hypothetical protein
MSGVPRAAACTTCGEHSHPTSKCNELWADTKEGFYSGGGSNRDYGDEDESKVINNLTIDDLCINRS